MNHYAFDMVFVFVASFAKRSIGFEASSDLIPLSLQYTDIVNKVLVDCTEVR